MEVYYASSNKESIAGSVYSNYSIAGPILFCLFRLYPLIGTHWTNGNIIQ